MSPEGIWRWSQIKGIALAGTGDFTHPAWIDDLKRKLEPAGEGLFSLRKEFRTRDVPASCRSDMAFMLSSEISCIYKKSGRTKKVHCIVLVPGFKDAEEINSALSKIGSLHSDGRPILKLDAKALLRIVLDCSPQGMLVPAHAWTPHFSIFGAVSGFDSIEECFEDLSPHIHAIETGLSSDPAMNRRLSALDRITLLSNSDAHSPLKIGREATIFNTDISFGSIMNAIRTGEGLEGTIEFFPEEGKYHYDGHRSCGVSMPPEDTRRLKGLCPVCGKKMTIGVSYRISELSDRNADYNADWAPPFRPVIPLMEVISEVLGKGVNTKAVADLYFALINELGSELNVLLEAPIKDIAGAGPPLLASAIEKMRSGDLHIRPGFDGEYGKISIFGKPDPMTTG